MVVVDCKEECSVDEVRYVKFEIFLTFVSSSSPWPRLPQMKPGLFISIICTQVRPGLYQLTGESNLITTNPGDIVLSGTTVVQGSSKLLVIAVGLNSVAGKIKARVYADSGGDGLDGDVKSPGNCC